LNQIYLCKEICNHLLTRDNIVTLYLYEMITVSVIILLLLCRSRINTGRFIFVAVITMINVEYFARWFNSINIGFNVDLITIYLFIWQLIALVFCWMWHELASPILFIEQVSICIVTGLEAFMLHNIILRYIPTRIIVIFLWLLSFVDK
jgi:hypothetical protein